MLLYNIFFLLLLLAISFFDTFYKSGIDKLTERSIIPARLSLMCFFNRGQTKRTHFFENFVFDVCVCFM